MSVTLKLKKLVDDFLAFSTLHGLNYVGERGRSKCLRYLWFTGVLVMFVVLVINIYWEYEEYKQYNYITKTNIKFLPKLEFPAITLCNAHSFAKDKFNTTSDGNVKDYFANIFKSRLAMQQRLNYSTEMWHNVIVRVENIINSTLNVSDTIQLAYIDDNPNFIFIKDKFKYTFPITLYPCLTFNEQWFEEIYNPLKFEINSKVIMYIDVNQDRYAFQSLTSGMSVYIHPSDEPARMSQPSVKLSPGQYHDIKLSYKQYQYLPEPYNSYQNSNCEHKSHLSNRLKYFPRYSQSACLLECLTDLVLEQCGCVVENILYNQSQYQFCSVYQREYCTNMLTMKFFTISQTLSNNCSCPLTCNEDVYERQLSSELFPSETYIDFLKYYNISNSLEHARNNLMRIDISFNTLKVEQIIHQPKKYLTDVISILGGYMGFFLGASIFTLLEIIDLIIRGVITVISTLFTAEIKQIRPQQ